ncbi:MAG: hypothetical protein ACREGF_02380 [Candidatus Saccharimonadales bacterium]
MELSRHAPMPHEEEYADEITQCRLEPVECEILRRAVRRKLVTGASMMSEEQIAECADFLSWPSGFVQSVGFPLNDELAGVCVEALEDAAALFRNERAMQVAYELAGLFRTELGV